MLIAHRPALVTPLCLRLLLAVVASSWLFCESGHAQPAAAENAKPAPQQGEIFPLPETITDLKQVMEFVQEIDSREPEVATEQEVINHQRKVARTVVAVAEKTMQMKLSDKEAMQSVFLKLQGLKILVELQEPKAAERLQETINSALSDKRTDVQSIGMKFLIEHGFGQWSTWGDAEKSELMEKIKRFVSRRDPDGSQVQLLMSVVNFLSQTNSESYAHGLLSSLIPHFQKSKDPQVQERLAMLEGVQRLLNLPGNEMDLLGTMLDGTKLDWSSYRGKVVLVDFWATWCGPCRAEVPNILKMYKAYHEKGFEVLGISLDKQPEQAEMYIEQMGIPWPTMFSKNPAERGWEHPMVVKYGISGIPMAILVDRDGKVVHMNARGENLGTELRRLLGEPVADLESAGKAPPYEVAKPIVSSP